MPLIVQRTTSLPLSRTVGRFPKPSAADSGPLATLDVNSRCPASARCYRVANGDGYGLQDDNRESEYR